MHLSPSVRFTRQFLGEKSSEFGVELGWNASLGPRMLARASGAGRSPAGFVRAVGRELRGWAEYDGVSERLKSLHEASGLDLGVAMAKVVRSELLVGLTGAEHVPRREQD